MTMRDPIAYAVFQDKTMFIPLRQVYPECWYHIKDHPQMYPLKCFTTDSCPVGSNCGEVLVKRIHYLFEEIVPKVEIIIAYYKYYDKPTSIRGAIFNKNLDPPKLSILNPYAFRKFLKESIVFQWYPSDAYLFMGGSKGILPVEVLLT
jgi:hypothetical protein